MKRTFFLLILLLSTSSIFAQAITDTGTKVGIGDTNPDEAISVNGNIETTTNNGKIGFNVDSSFLIDGVDIARYGLSTYGSAKTSLSGYFGLSFITHDIQRMTILNSGQVGIGTTEPDVKLTVQGHVNIGGTGNYHLKTRYIDGKETSSSNIDDLYLNYNTGKHVRVGFGDLDSNIYVSGKIGIGTTNPREKLEVNGLIRIPAATNENDNSPGITLNSNDDFLYDEEYINQYGLGFHGYQDGTSTYLAPNNTYLSGHFGLDFFTGSKNRMRISKSGEVTIGTVNIQNGFKLAVNGNIKAKEIKVETGWSDFVFYDDYNLPTLKEVEQHIKEKGHLKDIPSAKDVEQNGIFLGEMDAKLLQKIEELTLYIIEQEKKLQNQNIKIESQSDKIKELEHKNENLKSIEGRLKKLEKLLKL
ncbi:hypothetical protein [Neotamlana laminarinivorans]|uniref:Peptidase S74 domain-containing protein n=1 Tax=Neotamlana laminarinivorans TaxID=2883124 RepID=A0A9X1KZX7_9FLAO|nr:hypothetical protein [Tamlana laminarinivorans]MCB4797233.1 hypothetical protein [Tamlana laminarinivorans]